jgi:Protein of unknown function (DUF3592)
VINVVVVEMNKKQKNEIGAGLIVAILGSAIIIVSYFLFQDAQCFARNSYEVNATIISVQRLSTRDSKGHHQTTYSPKLRFITSSNQSIEGQASWSTRRDYKPGESNKILVDKYNPYEFKSKELGSVWGLPAIFLFIGIGCSAIGILVLTSAIRKAKR